MLSFIIISKSTLKNEHVGTKINVFTHLCIYGNHDKSRKTHLLLLNEAQFLYFFHVSGKYTFLFNMCFICLAIIAFKVQICPTYMVHLNSCRTKYRYPQNLKHATALGMHSVLEYSAPNQIIERTTRTGTGENEGNMDWRRTEGYGLERRKDIWIREKEEKRRKGRDWRG
jgi:hypothetical protein